MRHSVQLDQLGAALAKAQGEIQGAHKDKANPYFNSSYADLDSVWDACRRPLSENGLAVMQFPTADIREYDAICKETGDQIKETYAVVKVITKLVHSSGQWADSELEAESRDAGPQAIGSVITYLRRYLLQALVGVAPADDDGNAGQKPPQGAKTQPQPRQQAPANGNQSRAPSPPTPQFIALQKWVTENFPNAGDGWKLVEEAAKTQKHSMTSLRQVQSEKVFDAIKVDVKMAMNPATA